jgi:hypothetical protein
VSFCQEAFMHELSGYVFSSLREEDILLYRDSDRRRVADGIRHRLASATRALGPGGARGDRRDARLDGAGTNRQDESIVRPPQRSLCAGRYLL